MEDRRPDPDELLAKVERDQAKAKRGRLKIFFGAAAGVGKTYAMLQAAKERRAENIDIVIGLVETHGRKETAALLDGLDILPSRRIEYRGTTLREFDLDAAIKRKPSIIVVDELAHTNAPGSRHPKRWQDIEELRDAGIDVYTALNVQHLESLNDDIGQISGIRVWETVPDTVFESADEVELVDLPPDELLIRLKEGKVYLPQQARAAAQNFFRKGNLIALRELALRQTASQVDAQMLDYRDDHAIREVWQVNERILVCIGANALAERLVRAGKRLAASLRCEWIVAYVETPELQRMAPERRDAVLAMLRLAEQLGAKTVTLSAAEMSEAIIEFAQERNITKIVMGKPSRRGWRRWLMGSAVDTLIGHAHNINIYLLGSPQGETGKWADTRARGWPGLRKLPGARKPGFFRNHFLAACASLACAGVGWLMFGRVDLSNLVMVFQLGVVIVAAYLGRSPSILFAVFSAGLFDFLFVPPYFSLTVSDSSYVITLVAMVATAIIIGNLMANMRSQAKVAGHRERRAFVLYAMSRDLAAAQTEEKIVHAAVRHLYAEFGSKNVILFANDEGHIVYPYGRGLTESLCGADLSVAQWVYDHDEMAGQGSHTLPGAPAVYFPLSSHRTVVGVLAVLPANLRRIFLPEQRQLMDTFLMLITQAVNRVRLAEQARTSQFQMESERLRNALLSSISHDLRTPLATIVGSASTLAEDDDKLAPQDRMDLSKGIYDEALRMSGVITNILDMARLDAGAVQLDRQWHPVDEIVGTVLTRLQRRLESRPLKVKLPPEMTMIHVDSVLIEQVLINLLENALRYTPEGSALEITVERSSFAVEFSVADRGPGIPKGLELQLFEKFYQFKSESSQNGVGLGLAICRAVVEVHGGSIEARNRSTGGAIFSFLLPADQMPPTVAQEE